ncbi:SGNH/GDSL hydrolase family protein [Bosea sp. BIWAKO-01]|uniref:SGNH/GDSL hydrolase family protein n=1 Tax=Bosea sp. BIWAKO-01 TaxID=506668 RepID=UPI00114CA347|nr:SGNH/GDSL hydrolase family protein [Bosea sp. BIWAKO-01]
MNQDLETELIAALYRSVLGRSPDPIGLMNFLGLFRPGRPVGQVVEQIVESLLKSEEFRKRRPTTIQSAAFFECAIQEGTVGANNRLAVSASEPTALLRLAARKVDRFIVEELVGGNSLHRLVDLLFFMRSSLREYGHISGLDRFNSFFGTSVVQRALSMAGFGVEHVRRVPGNSIETRATPVESASGFSNKLYVIGDSHVRFLAGRDDATGGKNLDNAALQYEGFSAGFIGMHIGPALAFNLNRYGTKTRAREKIEFLLERHVPRTATIAFCFGEIDCRYHVCRQAETGGISVAEAAGNVAYEYLEFLDSIERAETNRVIYLPCVVTSADDWPDPEFPIYGTHVARVSAMLEFNRIMKSEATRRGIYVIDLLPRLSDGNYFPNPQFMIDPIHLSQDARFVLHELFPNGFMNNL